MKTWILLFAMFDPMMEKPDFQPITEKLMTYQECHGKISNLLIQPNVNYRTIKVEDYNFIHAVDFDKLLDAPSIVLHCHQTAEEV